MNNIKLLLQLCGCGFEILVNINMYTNYVAKSIHSLISLISDVPVTSMATGV